MSTKKGNTKTLESTKDLNKENSRPSTAQPTVTSKSEKQPAKSEFSKAKSPEPKSTKIIEQQAQVEKPDPKGKGKSNPAKDSKSLPPAKIEEPAPKGKNTKEDPKAGKGPAPIKEEEIKGKGKPNGKQPAKQEVKEEPKPQPDNKNTKGKKDAKPVKEEEPVVSPRGRPQTTPAQPKKTEEVKSPAPQGKKGAKGGKEIPAPKDVSPKKGGNNKAQPLPEPVQEVPKNGKQQPQGNKNRLQEERSPHGRLKDERSPDPKKGLKQQEEIKAPANQKGQPKKEEIKNIPTNVASPRNQPQKGKGKEKFVEPEPEPEPVPVDPKKKGKGVKKELPVIEPPKVDTRESLKNKKLLLDRKPLTPQAGTGMAKGFKNEVIPEPPKKQVVVESSEDEQEEIEQPPVTDHIKKNIERIKNMVPPRKEEPKRLKTPPKRNQYKSSFLSPQDHSKLPLDRSGQVTIDFEYVTKVVRIENHLTSSLKDMNDLERLLADAYNLYGTTESTDFTRPASQSIEIQTERKPRTTEPKEPTKGPIPSYTYRSPRSKITNEKEEESEELRRISALKSLLIPGNKKKAEANPEEKAPEAEKKADIGVIEVSASLKPEDLLKAGIQNLKIKGHRYVIPDNNLSAIEKKEDDDDNDLSVDFGTADKSKEEVLKSKEEILKPKEEPKDEAKEEPKEENLKAKEEVLESKTETA